MAAVIERIDSLEQTVQDFVRSVAPNSASSTTRNGKRKPSFACSRTKCAISKMKPAGNFGR